MNDNNYRIKLKIGDFEIEVEGDKEFVKESIEEYKEKLEKLSEDNLKNSQIKISKAEKVKKRTNQKLTLQKLYKILNPKTNLERIHLFAYHISVNDKVEEFNTDMILEYFNQLGLKKPANIPRDFKTLLNPKNKGFLILAETEGYYELSHEGREVIEKKLSENMNN